MTEQEAIKYLIMPAATSTDPGEEYMKQREAYEMAKDALNCTCCEFRVGDECCYAVYMEKEPLKWELVHGVMTPGGDPLVRCPVCKSRDSEHLVGIEGHRHWKWCPVCGERLDE